MPLGDENQYEVYKISFGFKSLLIELYENEDYDFQGEYELKFEEKYHFFVQIFGNCEVEIS